MKASSPNKVAVATALLLSGAARAQQQYRIDPQSVSNTTRGTFLPFLPCFLFSPSFLPSFLPSSSSPSEKNLYNILTPPKQTSGANNRSPNAPSSASTKALPPEQPHQTNATPKVSPTPASATTATRPTSPSIAIRFPTPSAPNGAHSVSPTAAPTPNAPATVARITLAEPRIQPARIRVP